MRRALIRRLLALACLAVLLVAGCTSRNTWRPTIDPYNDPAAERLGIDEAECRQIANQAAGGKAEEGAKRGALSGLFSAAMGAAVGAIWGSAGRGAATGAVVGAMSGGVGGAASSDAHFRQIFSNCMRGRGHNVLD